MKILYGVQGTGNGHISRARKMAAHFQARDADVTWLFSGREPRQFFDMETFGDFEYRSGLSMVQRNGAVLYWPTLRSNRAGQFLKDVRALNVRDYDLVITDFEPVTAWAARLADVTCIGIGHQYAFAHRIPQRGRNAISDLVMKYFAPVDIPVGLHWHHFNRDILPPIIDTSLRQQDRQHVLVYLPFEDQSEVTSLLRRFDQYQFVQYSPELEDAENGNVRLRRTNLHGFRADLCRSEAVICNAGFELVSECLHMGVAPLVKPVRGQMEQLSNALALEQLGWGSALPTLDAGPLGAWLESERRSTTIRYPDVANTLVDWVLRGEWRETEQLRDVLWLDTGIKMAPGS